MAISESFSDSQLLSEAAYDVLAYQRFIERAPTDAVEDAYLFYEPRVRFHAEADDVLVALRPLDVTGTSSGSKLTHRASAFSTTVPNLEPPTVQRILEAMDGTRTLLGVELAARARSDELDRLMASVFGRVVFAPQALERLEARVSGTELVRFVGSPYQIQRNYWLNMAECREHVVGVLFRCDDVESWQQELRTLHAIALMGRNRRSYYRPQSPLGKRDPRPGAFYTTETRSVQQDDLTLLIDGPRVSAPPVGGALYHQLLRNSTEGNTSDADTSQLDWGRVVSGIARGDAAPGAWFCPPRPLTNEHLLHLYRGFRACLRSAECEASSVGVTSELVPSLAEWHWQFVRLHPFRCANQSLGMNLVNAMLIRAARSAIPHLLLDQCALRLSLAAYRRVFARAVRYWGIQASSPLERWKELANLRAQLDAFVSQLAQSGDAAAASRLVLDRRDAAALALLVD